MTKPSGKTEKKKPAPARKKSPEPDGHEGQTMPTPNPSKALIAALNAVESMDKKKVH